jgi:hypothetical protein
VVSTGRDVHLNERILLLHDLDARRGAEPDGLLLRIVRPEHGLGPKRVGARHITDPPDRPDATIRFRDHRRRLRLAPTACTNHI